ncbi:hypothetical protein ACFW4K_20925 [Nocardiopsis alba]|uniref:hypothetical protein n=1 Tax=Nocardiopsis alba TaxID=53437 RepID=UPI00366B87D7
MLNCWYSGMTMTASEFSGDVETCAESGSRCFEKFGDGALRGSASLPLFLDENRFDLGLRPVGRVSRSTFHGSDRGENAVLVLGAGRHVRDFSYRIQGCAFRFLFFASLAASRALVVSFCAF